MAVPTCPKCGCRVEERVYSNGVKYPVKFCLAGHRQDEVGPQNYYEDVRRFHLLFHHPPTTPEPLSPVTWANRVKLIQEEWSETCTAYANGEFVDFADGLIDLAWVVLGTAVEAGLPWDALWEEVKWANMEKAPFGKDGKRIVVLDPSGKLLKPDGWKPPDISGVLRRHLYIEETLDP